MDNINREYIDLYINGLIKEEDEKLNKFREYCEERKLPIIHKEVGQFIKLIIKLLNAENIIEIGTNVGYSAIFMSRAMSDAVSYTHLDVYKRQLECLRHM